MDFGTLIKIFIYKLAPELLYLLVNRVVSGEVVGLLQLLVVERVALRVLHQWLHLYGVRRQRQGRSAPARRARLLLVVVLRRCRARLDTPTLRERAARALQ